MAQGNRPETRITATLLFPNKDHLLGLLGRDDLPSGADELIKENLAEIDSAFGSNYKENIGRRVATRITADLDTVEQEGSQRLLAGRVHLLTVQFGREVETLDEVFTHLAVIVRPWNMEDVRFYPQMIRWPAIDVNGNSRPTRFMMDVSTSQRGSESGLSVLVFNGGSLTADLPFSFKVI